MHSKDAKHLVKRSVSSALLSILLLTANSNLLAADAEPPEERWFEIEVILYKATSDNGLLKESWDEDTPFNLPENLVDFLNPIAPVESAISDGELSQNQDLSDPSVATKTAQSEQSLINNTVQSNTPSEGTNSSTLSSEGTLQTFNKEIPFTLLDSEFLALKKEAKNISVHPSFRLLSHFAWRQPVAGKSTAQSVRFAGGHDYSESFEFNGTKKLELDNQQGLLEQQPLDELDNEESLAQTEEAPIESMNQEVSSSIGETGSNIQDSEADNQVKLLPWVPEIDGSAKVYIYRNYLHLDADLVFRKPGQIEVDIYSLDTPLSFQNETLLAPITPMTNELQSIDDNQQLNRQLDKPQEQPKEDSDEEQFAWHFDSDFLNQDSEKVYTEKLFNYPLKQTRRMRSTELHYFDHPKIGMLVVIRPYQIDAESNEQFKQ